MTDEAKVAPSKDEALDELGVANQKIKELEEDVRFIHVNQPFVCGSSWQK